MKTRSQEERVSDSVTRSHGDADRGKKKGKKKSDSRLAGKRRTVGDLVKA
jgi:hypothetical protein